MKINEACVNKCYHQLKGSTAVHEDSCDVFCRYLPSLLHRGRLKKGDELKEFLPEY